jgi:hypothetical protein
MYVEILRLRRLNGGGASPRRTRLGSLIPVRQGNYREFLRSQTPRTAEVFYRIQLSQSLAITPDIQLIIDPALNPDDDSIFVAGLRMRMAL